jgi:hypothetical protein
MNESEIKKWGLIALAVIVVIFILGALGGCVEVGQTTGGVEVCTGDTTECGDAHDESDSSTTTTTN